LQRGRAYIVSSEAIGTPLRGRNVFGCNVYSSGEDLHLESIMPKNYAWLLDYLKFSFDNPDYVNKSLDLPDAPPVAGEWGEQPGWDDRAAPVVEEIDENTYGVTDQLTDPVGNASRSDSQKDSAAPFGIDGSNEILPAKTMTAFDFLADTEHYGTEDPPARSSVHRNVMDKKFGSDGAGDGLSRAVTELNVKDDHGYVYDNQLSPSDTKEQAWPDSRARAEEASSTHDSTTKNKPSDPTCTTCADSGSGSSGGVLLGEEGKED
jgi:hypothetical protein